MRKLPYTEAYALSQFYKKNIKYKTYLTPEDILNECGLMSYNHNFYISSVAKESFLFVVDEKKYVMSKIKYGF
jgi:hypothetical protein